MAKKNKRGGLVYSTNPDYSYEEESTESEIVPAGEQKLRIWLRRMKGNKEATVVVGFEGSDSDLSDLAKKLKSKCAAGGNAKNGEIIIQGNHRDKVLALLQKEGFSQAKKAGG